MNWPLAIWRKRHRVEFKLDMIHHDIFLHKDLCLIGCTAVMSCHYYFCLAPFFLDFRGSMMTTLFCREIACGFRVSNEERIR